MCVWGGGGEGLRVGGGGGWRAQGGGELIGGIRPQHWKLLHAKQTRNLEEIPTKTRNDVSSKFKRMST